MTGLDTTFIVQLACEDHPDHLKAQRALVREFEISKVFALAPQAIAEFIHVSSDPKRFAVPIPIPRALDAVESFLSHRSVRLVSPNESSLYLANKWMRQHKLGRKRVLDTHLAATYHLTGCRRLLTSNPSDFEIFNVFDIVCP